MSRVDTIDYSKNIEYWSSIFVINYGLFILSRSIDDTVGVIAQKYIFGKPITLVNILISLFIAIMLIIIVRYINAVYNYIIYRKFDIDQPLQVEWCSIGTLMTMLPAIFYPLLKDFSLIWLLLTNNPITAGFIDVLTVYAVYRVMTWLKTKYNLRFHYETILSKIFPTTFNYLSIISVIAGVTLYKLLLYFILIS